MASLPNQIEKAAFLQQLNWIADPIKCLEKASSKHPGIFTIEAAGFGTIVVLSDPQALKEAFANDGKKLQAKKFQPFVPIVGDNALTSLRGEPLRRQRQLIMPSFHGQRVQAYAQSIVNQVERVFNNVPQKKPFRALDLMLDISLETVLETVFGLSSGERYQQIKQALISMLDIVSSPLMASFLLVPGLQKDLGAWSPWGKFVRLRAKLDELIYTEISDRRTNFNSDRIDVLSMLMQAKDEEGQSMTDVELRDQLIVLLFAGYDTSVEMMSWLLYWAHYYPDIRMKLLAEFDSLGENPDPMAVSQLPYLNAVCCEAMRIYPVAFISFPREVVEPLSIMGHELQPGTQVCWGIYNLHHREDLYPQADKFIPERFLEREYQAHEFIPFGGGARRCIASALGMLLMKLTVFTVLTKYEVQLADNIPERPQRRGPMVIGAKRGVRLIINRSRVSTKTSITATVG